VQTFAVIAVALVVAWAALAIVAQRLNPEQSPLSMGMSGLARGHAPWVMKSAFLCRGASALALLIALPSLVGTAGLTLAGILAFWVWGVCSAALSLIDTDMPGEPASQSGAVHAVVAALACVCGTTGALVLSAALVRTDATAGTGTWALPLALLALAAMVLQFVAFGAAAQQARGEAAAPAPAAPIVTAPVAAAPIVTAPGADQAAAMPAAAAAPAPPQLGVPPQLGAPSGAAAVNRPARGREAGAPGASARAVPGRGGGRSFSLDHIGRYAGLFQRVFIGLLMAWTLLVALGVVRA
jgi:hypothetical protein